MMKRLFTDKKGVGIVAAVLIMLIVAVMGVTMASLLANNTSSSVNYLQSQQAIYLAESGLQTALFQISKGAGAWTGWSGTNPVTIQSTLTGYGDYNVSVANPNGSTPTITSTGYAPSRTAANKAVRVAQATAKSSSFFANYAVFSKGSVSMTGAAVVDSYNSGAGVYNSSTNHGSNGNVGTNADLSVSGSPYIHGNLMTGPSGTFNNQADVSGTITHTTNVTLPAVVVPGSLTGLTSQGSITSTTAIGPGNWKYSTINIGGIAHVTITGPANIYLTGSAASMAISNSAEIEIASGTVVFYVDGTVSVAGAGVVNDGRLPANLQIYGSSASSQNMSVTNGGEFDGVIYAPNGVLSVTGGGGVCGSIIGNQVTLSNSGAVHYDTALANLSGPSFLSNGWTITNWQEVY